MKRLVQGICRRGGPTTNNLLEKGWTKKQPFRKRLDQKLQPMAEKVGPKITTDGGKGSSEAGWAKTQPFRKRFKRSRWGQKHTFFKKKCSKKYRCVSGIDLEVYFR
jgi:hypothetical protein